MNHLLTKSSPFLLSLWKLSTGKKKKKQKPTEQLQGSELHKTSSIAPSIHHYYPPFTSVTPTFSPNSSAAGQMCGTRRCREILSSLPGDFQVHLVHMLRSRLSTPVPGRQKGCCHWSRSLADSVNDLEGGFGKFSWHYLSFFWPFFLCCAAFLSFFLSFCAHTPSQLKLTFLGVPICCPRDITVFFSNDIVL